MNIFDGHENKTTEELAAELGISDLAVVEKSSKDTIKTLEEEYQFSSVFSKSTEQEINDDNKWTNDFSKNELKAQMKILDKSKNITGTLLGFSNGEEEKIKIGFDNNQTDKWIPLQIFFDTYSIPEFRELPKKKPLLKLFGNAKAIKNWTKNFIFEELEIGIRVRKGSKYGKIISIDKDVKQISVVIENGEQFTQSIKDFLVFYSIFKEDLECTVSIGKYEIKDGSLWKEIPDMMLGVKRGSRLKCVDSNIYVLLDSEKNEFILKVYKTGQILKFSREELIEFFTVFQPDISLF